MSAKTRISAIPTSQTYNVAGSGRCVAFLMMLPLVTFEAQSLRSHAPDFLIEHSNLVIEGCLSRLLCIVGRILFRVFSTESLWISAIMPASVEDETTSDNICAPDSPQGHSLINCLMAFVGEQGRVVAHLDQAHFNQSLQITWTDGR
jgi:hypothetical protein